MDQESVPTVSHSKSAPVTGKGDSRYWLQPGKLMKRSAFFSCKIRVQSRRESFPLRTSNKATAASKAAEIYREVVAFGWEATLAKHKPELHEPATPATVGELLAEVKATAGFRATTFNVYSQCLRQIVAEIEGIGEQFLKILRGWRAQATGEFVVESDRKPRLDTTCAVYRCNPHFATLYTWLRKQGITSRKPLHELRKECGAILTSNLGIFAAQSVLRHAQIGTTAAYYADKKQRITTGLGSILESRATDSKLVPFTPTATPGECAKEAP